MLATPERMRLTEEGRAKIGQIVAAVWLLGSSDLPIDEIRTGLDALMVKLRQTVAAELVPSDGGASGSARARAGLGRSRRRC